MGWYARAQQLEGPFYYRIHPKGDISKILNSGLYSYSPAEGPGSYVDHPDMERWPDQDAFTDPQTYRFYVADSEWEVTGDRFRIRIPAKYIEDRLIEDHLGDYYIDTGFSSELILTPDQFEIDLGHNQWVRADRVYDKIMERYWRAQYKPPGFYGNRFLEEEDEDWGKEDENYEHASFFWGLVKQSQTDDWRLQRFMSPEEWEKLQELKSEYARVVDQWIQLQDRDPSSQDIIWKKRLDMATHQMKNLDKQLSKIRGPAEARSRLDLEQAQKQEQEEKEQTARNFNRAPKMGRKLEKDARELFGTTENPYLAGFIFTNGDMLSMSYDSRMRDMDHREIGEVMLQYDLDTGTEGMRQFMLATNAIRMSVRQRYAVFDIPSRPTRAQMRRMIQIIENTSDFNVTYEGKGYVFYPDDLEEFMELLGYGEYY